MNACTACKKELDPGSKFCKRCGFRVAPLALSPLDEEFYPQTTTDESPTVSSGGPPPDSQPEDDGATQQSIPAVATRSAGKQTYSGPPKSQPPRQRTFTGPPKPPPIPRGTSKAAPQQPAPPAAAAMKTIESLPAIALNPPESMEALPAEDPRPVVSDALSIFTDEQPRPHIDHGPPPVTADALPAIGASGPPPIAADELPAISVDEVPLVTADELPAISVDEVPLVTADELPAISVDEPPPPAVTHAPTDSAQQDGPRRSPRFELKADVTYTSEHNFYTGFLQNISDGGLFIGTYDLVPIGETVNITFTIPGVEGALSTSCEVRWVREHNPDFPDMIPGMGLAFSDLRSDAARAIDAFIKHRDPIFFDD